MNRASREIYHRLPPAMQSLTASVYGARVKRRRYGSDTSSIIDEAAAREYWTPQEWEAWRAEQLIPLLRRARSSVPHYRSIWDARTGTGADSDRLSDWPVLEKPALREDARAFLADGSDPRRMWHEHTSGTTGTAIDLWWSWETVRYWYALYERRIRHWHGVTRFDRWAMLGGQLVINQARSRPPYWIWNAPMGQLYLSSYHVGPRTIASYLDAMRRYQVRYAVGFTSALYALAALAEEYRIPAPPLAVVITNAEPVFEHQRSLISRVFQCPVRETYGMSEIVACATECERGSLHLWPDVGITEVLSDADDVALADGMTGRLVCTGLINGDMPLIRYEVGDRAALAPAADRCACGRTLPLVAHIDGRNDDMIVTPDGRLVGRLDPVFKGDMHIREAQIIQESGDLIHVRLVPAADYSPKDQEELRRRLVERLGEMRYEFEIVDSIARTKSGKFRAVVSHLRHGSAPIPAPLP